MGHHITAIIIAGAFDPDVAQRLDLIAVPLVAPLTMFHIDHCFTAYWQAVRACQEQLDVPAGFPGLFPNEGVVAHLVAEATGRPEPTFALIMTDYFAGNGSQWACLFRGTRRDSPDDARINDVLRMLGVIPRDGLDEFDTVGLADHRHSPEHIDRYAELCDELGV